MTKQELDAIRERCEAAPQGPWSNIGDWAIIQGTDPNHGNLIGSVNKEGAEFIAHAREDIPALLAEIERISNTDDIKGKIVVLVKDAYQQGYQDGQSGDPAFEDGIEADVWIALSDIFGELEELANEEVD